MIKISDRAFKDSSAYMVSELKSTSGSVCPSHLMIDVLNSGLSDYAATGELDRDLVLSSRAWDHYNIEEIS